ncbi:hypothetical protein VTJ49DRAFT_1590 [Mycothermus thermophilus]|uniref:S-adenosyl-L-methionine-dependent methyltransferase n=1 Tax=Humicola insolens TaxID=85995 RepID=A0ABR3VDR9_HUMIN
MASRMLLSSSRRSLNPSLRVNLIPNHNTRFFSSQPPTSRAARPPPKPPLPPRSRIPHPYSSPASNSNSNSKPNVSDNSTPRTLPELLGERKLAFFGAAFTALVIGAYVSNLVISSSKETPCSCSSKIPVDPFTLTTSSSTSSSQDANNEEQQPTPPTGLPPSVTTTFSPAHAEAEARAFDRSLRWDERLMGITDMRRDLARLVKGHVLEVAVGTGRNLEYLDWSGVVAEAKGEKEESQASSKKGGEPKTVTSYTGVDVSGPMLGVARDRVRESVPGLAKVMRKRRAEPMPRLGELPEGKEQETVVDVFDGRVRLVLGDALKGLPPPSSPSPTHNQQEEKYDTILQTFGLCSVPDPLPLLSHMASSVKPETGRILLLEHGRSATWTWINQRLDKDAADHFSKFGCWWNRDIEGIVREAARRVPGLEVVRVERPGWFQFGTTVFVELRVR